MKKLFRCMLLGVFGPLAGVVYALAAALSGSLTWKFIGGTGAPWDPRMLIFFAIWGALLGLISLLYVVPTLISTELLSALPRVFLKTVAAAAVSGLFLPLAPAITLWVHASACVREKTRASLRPKAHVCTRCHYPLVGLPTPICPECGTDSSLAQPG